MKNAGLNHVTSRGNTEERESKWILSNQAKVFELLNGRDRMNWDNMYLNVISNRNTTGYCGEIWCNHTHIKDKFKLNK